MMMLVLAIATGCSASSSNKAIDGADNGTATGAEGAETSVNADTKNGGSDAQTEATATEPAQHKTVKKSGFKEVSHPTPNTDPKRKNSVQGVILHHTAEPTVERSLEVLTVGARHVGTHVVIDTDGTRYVMCSPETVTFHAGPSVLDGKESCNGFTIGIEFQGNTLEAPLTDEQIYSAIEYLRPLIKKYNIPRRNIVTHKMIRDAYKKKYPNKKVSGKVDITDKEYQHFLRIFNAEMPEK